MGFIDWIKQILGNGKKNAKFYVKTLKKNIGEPTPLEIGLYDGNNPITGEEIGIEINNRQYIRTTDENGIATLNINLDVGKYTAKIYWPGINGEYNSVTGYVDIIVEPQPEPEPPAPEETPETPTGQESRHVKILNYFEDHFGECEYIDDALEAIQGLGYSFYFSDGYNMYETIDNVANGNGANCFDIAEVLYHCAKGMNEKYGRNYEVQYLDVWCPVSGYDHIRLRLKSNGSDWFYRDGACVLDGGDITDNWCGTSDNILEVNPSWIYDGD